MPRYLFAANAVGLVVACLSGGCGSSDTTSGSGGGGAASGGGGAASGGGGGSAGASEGGGGHGSEIMPSPNTPPSCASGTTACHPEGAMDGNDPVCTDTQTDAYNCGKCDNQCDIGPGEQSCVNGKCVDNGPCGDGVVCNGTCVVNRNVDPDNCGGCDNRCGERGLCAGFACVDTGGGTGFSCSAPLLLPEDGRGGGFDFGGALTGTHKFSCGPAKALPTRFLRLPASSAGSQVKVLALPGPDGSRASVIAEVFDSPCPTGGGAGLSCDAGSDGGEAQVTYDGSQQVYVVAVGVMSGDASAISISY